MKVGDFVNWVDDESGDQFIVLDLYQEDGNDYAIVWDIKQKSVCYCVPSELVSHA